ncbi:MAG: hypothetical protein F6J89_12510 [Symploca sp. SIO1C4]|uniref:Calcineurin-like phosphoesterase domain-containing protein n=1 Tax=Symploca sp. SIO1C4 TaxID=2607765 RepID=A0A6B3NBX1_9CYAN|nr:hypothetical protein [Symploca sp. SIO1C4]
MVEKLIKIMVRLVSIALLPLLLIGFLVVLPSPVEAFNVYNETSLPINSKSVNDYCKRWFNCFDELISPGNKGTCPWDVKRCNSKGGRQDDVKIWMETEDDFLCILPMHAGGYAVIEEVKNRYTGRNDYKCLTYNRDGDEDYPLRTTSPYGAGGEDPRNVHFLITADPQYENKNEERNEISKKTIKKMKSLFKDTTDMRGVVIAGDLTQNAIKDPPPSFPKEYEIYQESIQGQARFFFDGLGNHDLENTGWTSDPEAIKDDIKERKRGSRVYKSSSKLHYSWDWDDVHFVQLNLFPGDESAPQFPQLDPQESLSFLKKDLNDKVGSSRRPIVLISHYGFDPFSLGNNEKWWTEEQRKEFWDAIADYNVLAIFTGHIHPFPKGDWKYPFKRPNGSSNGPDEISTFVSGATLKAAFLDVNIDQSKITIERWGFKDGELKMYDNETLRLN